MTAEAHGSTAELLQLAHSVGDDYTIPGRWYTDPDFARIEEERLFRHGWQFAGFTSQVAEAGDYFTCRAWHIPVIVVRASPDALNAFANVCRHRGSLIVEEPANQYETASCHGNRRSLQCMYHGWTYGLDGSLRAAPGLAKESGLDTEELGLWPVQVDTWGPLVFVNPDPNAGPLAETLAELPGLVDALGIDLHGLLKPRGWRSYAFDSNWKISVDNFLECYHCAINHPALVEQLDMDRLWCDNSYDTFLWLGFKVKSSSIDVVGDAYAGVIWPNFAIGLFPGEGFAHTNLFVADGIERSIQYRAYCFAETVSDEIAEENMDFMDQVVSEDQPLCARVQQGVRSGLFDQGYVMDKNNERSIGAFHRYLARELAASEPAESPAQQPQAALAGAGPESSPA